MTLLLHDPQTGDEVAVPTVKAVCDRCHGTGTHVNPAVDGNGLSRDDFDELGDDFRDDYFAGVYDVRCEECHGNNVVDVVDEDAELTPAQVRALDAEHALPERVGLGAQDAVARDGVVTVTEPLRGRGDIHSPANFNPENYEFVGAFDNDPGDFRFDETGEVHIVGGPFTERAKDLLLLVQSSPSAPYANGHRCDHCGANIRYVGVFKHLPTGDHIAVGQVCTDGRFQVSKAEFDRLRKTAQLARERKRFFVAWEAFKTANDTVDWDGLYASENPFVVDVLRRGRQYGNLSERQLETIQTAVARDAERERQRAEREANPVPTVPVPEGNGIVITGKLVSTKWKETQWGSTLKGLVVVTTPDGEYKVWGSLPKGLQSSWSGGDGVHATKLGAEVGDTVTFTANVTRSDDDESFGFWNRPRKASVTERGSESAE